MDRFEYAMGLMSIIVGLGLADLAMSLHRLLKNREQVRWDWVALATAAFAGFTLVRMWYQLWVIRDFPEITNLFLFLSLVLSMFLVFLASAASLPDDADPPHLRWDLRAYYHRHARYIWVLLALFQAVYLCHALYFNNAHGAVSPPFAYWLRFGLAPWAIMIALVFARSRRLQGALVATVFLLEVVNTWNDGL
jgi:hypothetical protein